MSENSKKETLQDIGIKLVEEQLKSQLSVNGPKERTIFIFGSKNVGKSTIINRYLDRDEVPKPTLALEYSFGRRSSPGQGIQKQVCNVWELGCLTNSEQLLETPFRSHGLTNCTVIFVLDLSQPNKLWNELEVGINGVKNAIFNVSNSEELKELQENAKERVGIDNLEMGTFDLLPIPIVFVGGKYDVFQDMDPEIKKQICRCLRSVSHILGGSVLYYSSQNSTLSKQLRDLLNHCGFGSPSKPIRTIATDYNGPLSIPYGGDSWNNIGRSPCDLEAIGLHFSTHIEQVDNTIIPLPSDPAKDSGFHEAVIDELRAQKEEEFLGLLKNSEVTVMFERIIE